MAYNHPIIIDEEKTDKYKNSEKYYISDSEFLCILFKTLIEYFVLFVAFSIILIKEGLILISINPIYR